MRATAWKEPVLGPVCLVAQPDEGREAARCEVSFSAAASAGEPANLPLGPHLCHQRMGKAGAGCPGRREQVRRGGGGVGQPRPGVTHTSKALSFEPAGLSGNTEWVRVTRAAAVCKVADWCGQDTGWQGWGGYAIRERATGNSLGVWSVHCPLPQESTHPGEGQGGALVQEPVAGGTKREGRREDAGGQGPSDPLVPGQGPLPLSDRAGSRPPTQ